MSDPEGIPEWKMCIKQNNRAGLNALLSKPGFDCQQFYSFSTGTSRTPLGYALLQNQLWAVELLLKFGVNPNATCTVYPKRGGERGGVTARPLELWYNLSMNARFLHCLLWYGASTMFFVEPGDIAFVDHVNMFIGGDMIRAAHFRELRAYAACWCANNAGGCWPDMAMLLQAVIMRDELREKPPTFKKHRN